MEQQIDDLINKLKEFKSHVAGVNDIEKTHAGVQADLTNAQAALSATKDELARAKAGLSASQLKSQQEFEQAIHDKQQELVEISARVSVARDQLKTLQIEVKAAEQQHDQIEASIESLRRKIA